MTTKTTTRRPKTRTGSRAGGAPEFVDSKELDIPQLIEQAQATFYDDANVIGVGVGERRRGGQVVHDDFVLIVYVKEKMAAGDVPDELIIPENFGGLDTDVVAPFGPDAPLEALGFAEGHQLSDDMSFIDWPRMHEQWMAEAGGDIAFHGKVEDFGDVCVIEDDGTLVQTVNGQQVVDYVRAYKLFRTTHNDIYDFCTFFTDTANGMPPQGGSSWYRFVFNDTKGIGFSHNFNQRAGYGTNKLQGIMFLNQGHFSIWRYVMLQEQAHRWACFARYRDSATGPLKNDHLLGGWGHWHGNLDDDRSPMDYDAHDWVAENGNFRKVTIPSEERTFCNLDLYLMGLLDPEEVGDFYLLSSVANISGNLYSANKKRLNVQNVLWAEGARVPAASKSQKLFKTAFVVLTKDLQKVHDLADQVDFLRLRFERDFRQATKELGAVDTTLGPIQVHLTPSQAKQLTSGGYTGLHKHIVRVNDLRITGRQFTGTINPGQTQRWFTHSWPVHWHVQWSVLPTTVVGGGPKLTWDVATERTTNGITYWITIRSQAPQPIAYEAKYCIAR